MHIAVVGCGIGGMASAILLARQGHRVQLFEKQAKPQPLGAGFLLQPTGLAVLEQLGLLKAAEQFGAKITRLHGSLSQGRTIFDLKYADLGTTVSGLGIHRGALFTLLFDACTQAGVEVVPDFEVHALNYKDHSTGLIGSNNRPLAGFEAEYDLAVIADGSRSNLRQESGLLIRDQPYPWGALWTICNDRNDQFNDALEQVFDTAKIMIGALPVGRTDANAKKELISFFWSLPTAQFKPWRTGDFHAWKTNVANYWPKMSGLLENLNTHDVLLTANYGDAVLHQPYRQRTVFIGDAAHAMSPQLGQGANLALLDAAVLAHSLTQHPIDKAIARYAQSRKAHVQFYQRMSRWLTPFYQSNSTTNAAIRDVCFPLLQRNRWVYQEMLATLAGLKTGWLSQSPPETLIKS